MSQVGLLEYDGSVNKLYSKNEVEDMISVWSTGQVALCGMNIGSAHNKYEEEWIKAGIFDALNHPEKFDCECNDTFGALMVLKDRISGGNVSVLKDEYGIPPCYEYRNNKGVNAIVDVNHDDEVVFPFTAGEVLDIICDLNKNRSVDDILRSYDFYHGGVTGSVLVDFNAAYVGRELNRLVKHICHKSNELGGFMDHGVGVLRNRLTSQYLFDSRKIY